jgi:hypothetical protein
VDKNPSCRGKLPIKQQRLARANEKAEREKIEEPNAYAFIVDNSDAFC